LKRLSTRWKEIHLAGISNAYGHRSGADALAITGYFYDLLLEEHIIVVTAIKRRTSTTY
jgi:hypothetical protein